MPVIELIASIAGLIAFTLQIIDLLNSLKHSIPKSAQLLSAIRNLHHVLERIASEYMITIRSFPQLESNHAGNILRECIQDIKHVCTEYGDLLQKISATMGGLRQIKWRMSEGERVELGRRLEAGKSTLQLFLTQLRYVTTQTYPY